MTAHSHRASVRVAFFAILLVLLGTILEVGARLTFAYKEQVKAWLPESLFLDSWEVADPDHPGHWRLRPGFVQTFKEALKAKQQAGRVLGGEYLLTMAAKRQIRTDDVLVRINADGFRGPAIDRTHSRPRILAIGDSCTFGMSEKGNYPRVLERELTRLGRSVEVVNGGVQGYSPKNVLLRIDDFKTLQPELTTIYIGWNGLYSDTFAFGEPHRGPDRLYILRLFTLGYLRVFDLLRSPQVSALSLYGNQKHPDRDAIEVRKLDRFVPRFMLEVKQIVREMRSAGSRVVILTLPGLYTMRRQPSAAALKVGHLPAFTDNPFVLAKMTERYNIALRELAVGERVQLVDLEQWSFKALEPREKFFFDSVHLYEDGQEMLGAYLAQELAGSLPTEDR